MGLAAAQQQTEKRRENGRHAAVTYHLHPIALSALPATSQAEHPENNRRRRPEFWLVLTPHTWCQTHPNPNQSGGVRRARAHL